jgi:hypothetical protein
MKKLSKKEKRDLALILGSVLVVAVIGLLMTLFTSSRLNAIAGAAISIDSEIPTKEGMLIYMNQYCSPSLGSGDCNTICGEKVCVPLEQNCDLADENNECLCCEKIQ